MRNVILFTLFTLSTAFAAPAPKDGTMLSGLGIEIPVHFDSVAAIESQCTQRPSTSFAVETPVQVKLGTVVYRAALAYCNDKSMLDSIVFKNESYQKLISIEFFGDRIQAHDGPRTTLPIQIKNFY